MRSDIAISVSNLRKTYRIFGHPGDRIKQALTLGRMRFHREFTALQDVSFEIRQGETLGIIGRNGSGKSTLLQLICGITKPTAGEVQASGRISALLELGSGFNPEFTGRENVYFQGAILGFPARQIDQRINDILAFADIGEFIDQPVRTYSSGMYVRLAFAAAIHQMPDILVVDEALSVGDKPFQRKCFERIRQLRKQGVTIVYVSHNLASVIDLCDRAMLLEQGMLAAIGAPKTVVADYLKNTGAQPAETSKQSASLPVREEYDAAHFDHKLVPESTVSYPVSGAEISNPRILSLEGKRVNLLRSGEEYIYAYDVRFNTPAENVRFGMMIKTIRGFDLGGIALPPPGEGIAAVPGMTHSAGFRFRCNLLPGDYFLNAGVTCRTFDKGEVHMHRILDAAMFRIIFEEKSTRSGIVDFAPLQESSGNEIE